MAIDSRENLAGKIFFAIKGDRFDGHDFLGDAVRNGALAIVVHQALKVAISRPRFPSSRFRTPVQRWASWPRAYRQMLKKTTVIAVVGSAGKTTTKRLIDAALCKIAEGFDFAEIVQ